MRTLSQHYATVAGLPNARSAQVLRAIASAYGIPLQVDTTAAISRSAMCTYWHDAGTSADVDASSSLHLIRSDDQSELRPVSFSNSAVVPLPFRGRTVMTSVSAPAADISTLGTAIASVASQPIWTTSICGRARHDVCVLPAPWIDGDDCVFSHLNGGHFMGLLPIVEWFRWISNFNQWSGPAPHACFMFDDPNLHAPRYGYIDFRQLAQEGARHRFHCAFATVPLDSYFAARDTSQIFAGNQETLSLLIHGNNHTYRELADSTPSPERRILLMQQALQRISRLERRSGVSVSRVMAPPHGVCSAAMMDAMAFAGFEAVTVSHGSVWTGNPAADWTVALGIEPAAIVHGLPVIARFGLDGDIENEVLLKVYLRQPIVAMGHHWDLADGTDILTAAATVMNSIASITWRDARDLARANYQFRFKQNDLHVRTYATVTTISIPEGIERLRIEPTWFNARDYRISADVPGTSALTPSPGNDGAVLYSVAGHRTLTVTIKRNGAPSSYPELGRTPLHVVARRLLSEARDRCAPRLPRSLVRLRPHV